MHLPHEPDRCVLPFLGAFRRIGCAGSLRCLVGLGVRWLCWLCRSRVCYRLPTSRTPNGVCYRFTSHTCHRFSPSMLALASPPGPRNGNTHRLATPIASHQLSWPSMLALALPSGVRNVTHTDWQAHGGWQKNRGRKIGRHSRIQDHLPAPHFSVKRTKLGRPAMSPGVASVSQQPLSLTHLSPIEPAIYAGISLATGPRNGNTPIGNANCFTPIELAIYAGISLAIWGQKR